MRPSIGVTFLFLLLAAAPALACGPTFLYFLNTAYAWDYCSAELIPGETVEIRVRLEAYGRPDPLAELGFRAENWIAPGDPPLGEIVTSWTADEVEGDLATGITLRWHDGLPPVADDLMLPFHLGTIAVTASEPGWVPDHHLVTMADLVFTDTSGHTYYGADIEECPSQFTFNGYGDCVPCFWDPQGFWCTVRYPDPPDGATVAGVFQFTAEAECWHCESGLGYLIEGAVSADGVEAATFAGWGEAHATALVDVRDYPDGSEVTVCVHADLGPCGESDHCTTYLVDATATSVPEPPPAQPLSFTAVKARY